jgi:Family of unknown function (DUF6210)
MADERYVYLWSLPSPVIIVPGKTGIVYCNQTDGVATVHREAEGWLLPLPKVEDEIFTESWWYKHHNRRLAGDEEAWGEICRRIELALGRLQSGGEAPSALAVLPHPDNSEAWVHVSFLFTDLGPTGEGSEQVPTKGILTWENCD